jgi:hypothetical protein
LEAATTGDLRGVELVVIHHGDVESTKGYVHGMPATVRPVSDSARNLARLWQVRRTPYFVVTGPGGLVRGKGISLRGAESAYAVASGQQADGDSARWSRGSQMMVR